MPGEFLHLPTWATSVLGRPLELFQNVHREEAPILFIGGMHGDEPEGVALAKDFLQWLLLSNSSGERTRSWALIPCLNPDGYSQKDRCNGNSVDLNRNFPSQDWSPLFRAPRYFPGNRAGSEPEVQAICQWLSQNRPELIVHFHSWEPCVIYSGDPAKSWAEVMAAGTPCKIQNDIGYPTPGSLGQYAWLNLKTPVLCLEAQERTLDLAHPWRWFGPGLRTLMKSSGPLFNAKLWTP